MIQFNPHRKATVELSEFLSRVPGVVSLGDNWFQYDPSKVDQDINRAVKAMCWPMHINDHATPIPESTN